MSEEAVEWVGVESAYEMYEHGWADAMLWVAKNWGLFANMDSKESFDVIKQAGILCRSQGPANAPTETKSMKAMLDIRPSPEEKDMN